jgi:hypothetical protein
MIMCDSNADLLSTAAPHSRQLIFGGLCPNLTLK